MNTTGHSDSCRCDGCDYYNFMTTAKKDAYGNPDPWDHWYTCEEDGDPSMMEIVDKKRKAYEQTVKHKNGLVSQVKAERSGEDMELWDLFLSGNVGDGNLNSCSAQTLRDLFCLCEGKPTGRKSSGKLMKKDLIHCIRETGKRIGVSYRY